MQSTHLLMFEEIHACSGRHRAHSNQSHQHRRHSTHQPNKPSNCSNYHSLHPRSPPINRLAGQRPRPHHVPQLIPNYHGSPQMKCTFSNHHHPINRQVHTHCNKPRHIQSNLPHHRRYTSTTGYRRLSRSQLHHKRQPAKRNPALLINSSQKPAITATARASAKHKVVTNRSHHRAARHQCRPVLPSHRALGAKVLAVVISGVAAISSAENLMDGERVKWRPARWKVDRRIAVICEAEGDGAETHSIALDTVKSSQGCVASECAFRCSLNFSFLTSSWEAKLCGHSGFESLRYPLFICLVLFSVC